MGSGPALCESCSQRIIFVTVLKAAGGTSRMPLNEHPDEGGNVAVYTDATGSRRGRVLSKTQDPDPHEKRYMPHFVTCHKASAHRKPRQPAPPKPPAPQPAGLFEIGNQQ